VIEQSCVIDLYRTCYEGVQRSYQISKGSTRHTKPDVEAIIQSVQKNLVSNQVNKNLKNRAGGPRVAIKDRMAEGQDRFQLRKSWMVSDAEETEDGVADDVYEPGQDDLDA
jgi:hypothetical protein